MLAFPQHQNISDLCSTYDSLKPSDELLKNGHRAGFLVGCFFFPHPVSVWLIFFLTLVTTEFHPVFFFKPFLQFTKIILIYLPTLLEASQL